MRYLNKFNESVEDIKLDILDILSDFTDDGFSVDVGFYGAYEYGDTEGKDEIRITVGTYRQGFHPSIKTFSVNDYSDCVLQLDSYMQSIGYELSPFGPTLTNAYSKKTLIDDLKQGKRLEQNYWYIPLFYTKVK